MSSLKVGIVGLPNVGKSTLFNALLGKQQALAANYPFATIEPNVGVVAVPDERLQKLAQVVNSQNIVPATVEFLDIAGLVKGAASGEGLGNKFLSHIREVDLVCHVLRHFEDGDILREGSVEPKSDYEVIVSELILKDLETVEKQEGTVRKMGGEWHIFWKKLYEHLNSGKQAKTLVVSEKEMEWIKTLFLLTMKDEVAVVNISEGQIGNALEIEQEFSSKIGLPVVALNAKLESELSGLGREAAMELLSEYGITESGLDRLIRLSYGKLGLMSFLTAGEKEVRAWTIRAGSKAPQAAGVIHTDFEKKFIRAKACSFTDFVELGGWKNASEKGKVRMEGRDYLMQEGDVVEFMVSS